MELVLEVIGTTNNVLERQRFAKNLVRIGRGYSNDVILSDEHADVSHAELHVDSQQRVSIRDLNSVNGTLRRKGRQRITQDNVASGDIFVIGRNRLRVLFPDHEMPAAVPLRPIESFLLWLGRSPVIALLFAIYAAMTYARTYNATLGDFNWSTFIRGQMTGVLLFLGLVAGVYLLSVLFKRSGNFLSHLSVLLFVAVLSSAVALLLDTARFNGGDHSYEFINAMDSAVGYGFTFLYLWSVLYLAFNLSLRARSIVSASLVAVAITFSSLTSNSWSDYRYRPRFPVESTFLPDQVQFAQPLAPARYNEEVDALFVNVGTLRQERLEDRDGVTAVGSD
ncbi:MAG: FHA domain-containing protein [Pseudomonadota bacterium]